MFLLTENLNLMAFRDLEVFNTVPWPPKFGDGSVDMDEEGIKACAKK